MATFRRKSRRWHVRAWGSGISSLFVAQVWLRAMLSQLYIASGQDESISGCGAVTPLQVSMAIGSDVQSHVDPEMGVPLVQYGQIALDGGKPMEF